MTRYLDQTATATAIVVAILLTDHLFSPVGTTVKQLALSRPQLVQKPCALSLHVPALLLPDSARGSRVIFPSGVKVILNLTPLSVAAVKGWPLKNVAWMSLGAMGSAAKALLAWKSIVATTNGSARIEPRGDGQPLKTSLANIHAITRFRRADGPARNLLMLHNQVDRLAAALHDETDVAAALRCFEAARLPVGRRIIDRARHLGAYLQVTQTAEELARSRRHSIPEAVLEETGVLDFPRT